MSEIPPLPPPLPVAGGMADAQRAAQNFTAVVLGELLEPVFATIPCDGPLDGGVGERTFRPMLVEQMAKQMARTGGLGLTEAVRLQILRLQETAR